MNTTDIIKTFSAIFKEDEKIFQFNLLNETLKHERINIKEFEAHRGKSLGLISYEYMENLDENWVDLRLTVSLDFTDNILGKLNNLFKDDSFKIDKITLSNGFEHKHKDLIVFYAKSDDMGLIIHITKPKGI